MLLYMLVVLEPPTPTLGKYNPSLGEYGYFLELHILICVLILIS